MPAGPDADLVAEHPKSSGPPASYGAFGNDSTLFAAQIGDRSLLDHELLAWKLDLQGRVIEVISRPTAQGRGQGLVDATIDPDRMPAGAEREPVQVDAWRSRLTRGRFRLDLTRHLVSVSAKSRQAYDRLAVTLVGSPASVANTGPTTRSRRMHRAKAGRTVFDMTTKLPAISRFLLLAGFAYLGFYVYGIVMGVFAPSEIPLFTVIAVAVVVAAVVHLLRVRTSRAVEDPEERRERMHEEHELRERRGF